MTTQYAAPMIAEGVWVMRPGGVRVMLQPPSANPPAAPVVTFPPRFGYDPSTLRACRSCPALLAERCVSNRTGKVRPYQHAGRLVSLRCTCGAVPPLHARLCPSCAFEKWAAA